MEWIKKLWHRLGSPRWFFHMMRPWQLGLGIAAFVLLCVGTVWGLALLSSLLSLDGMFRRDFSDGTLEQLLLVAEVPFLAILGINAIVD